MNREVLSIPTEDMVKILTAAIEVGSALAQIKRFGYPARVRYPLRDFEKAVTDLQPYGLALIKAVEPYPGKQWITDLIQIEPK